MPTVPSVTLNNGVSMPQLGFGVFQIPDNEVGPAVEAALDAGYRSIDTAAAYGNEAGTGKAIAASGIARDELFVTTKLWNTDQGYDATLRAFEASLSRLGMDYVDLYLIHWPAPKQDAYLDTWKAFEKLYADGRVRAIGVSNFKEHHLQRLFDANGTVPAVNQVELHPRVQQPELRQFHAEHGVATEAWSPIGQGKGLLDEKDLADLAGKHGKTPAQVVLRWHLQLGNIAIPKSVTPSRISANLDVFDFALDDNDLNVLAGMDAGRRIGPDPDEMD